MKTHQVGVSMIEVVVTMLILGVGLLGMAKLQSQAVKDNFDTTQRSQAMWLAHEITERMRANPSAWTDYVDTANANICNADPALRCADYSDGTNKINASDNCTAANVAAFDLWEVFCGNTVDGSVNNAVDGVNINSIAMSCDGGCGASSTVDVEIQFSSKSVIDSTDLEITDALSSQSIRFSVRPVIN